MDRLLDIHIETIYSGLDLEMFGAQQQVAAGAQIVLVDGSTVTWSSAPLRRYAVDPYVFNLVTSLASGDAGGVLGDWLFVKLKGRADTLRINRTDVEIKPDKIRIVIEQIERDRTMSLEGQGSGGGKDELSITFGIVGDQGTKSVRSAPIHVAAEIAGAKSSTKKLTGRMLYLVPRQLREIKDSNDVIASFEGTDYRFVRLDSDGSFELRRDA